MRPLTTEEGVNKRLKPEVRAALEKKHPGAIRIIVIRRNKVELGVYDDHWVFEKPAHQENFFLKLTSRRLGKRYSNEVFDLARDVAYECAYATIAGHTEYREEQMLKKRREEASGRVTKKGKKPKGSTGPLPLFSSKATAK